MREQPSEWEETIANKTTDSLQNIQAVHAAQHQKNEQPNQTVGRRPKQTFLQGKTYRWLITTWRDAQHCSLLEKCNSKPPWGYHLTPVRMAIIKKSTNNECWIGCEEGGTLLHCWRECKLIQPLWRTVWRFLRKLGIKLPYNPGPDAMIFVFWMLSFKPTFSLSSSLLSRGFLVPLHFLP